MAQKFLTDIDVSGKLIIDGSNFTSGSLLLEVQGTQGQLFSVTDSLTGDLFSVSDISGIPILNVNSSGAITFDGYIPDNNKLKFGNSGDLEIYHDGSNSYIQDAGTGNLIITASSSLQLKSAGDEFYMIGNADGQVALYNNGIKKFETTGSGVDIIGGITFGDSHFLGDDGNNNLLLQSSSGEAVIINGNTNVRLQDGGNTKLTTTSTGVDVTGNVGMSTGNSTGKFAVMSAAVHASYDFYNNGTSYFNGSVVIDDTCLFSDDKQLRFGASNDFLIYHNSTTNVNHVSSQLDRQLSINANVIQLTNQANNSTYLKLESGTATFAGNIVMAANATVDGVDISALPTSFAPVDAEANVYSTAAELLAAIKTVDGSGSGLDADTLDTYSSSSFARKDEANPIFTGGLSKKNSRYASGITSEYPLGHYTPGDTVFEIDPTWNDTELKSFFNSNNVTWATEENAPGGYSIYINSNVGVGAPYGSGFPLIPIDQDATYYQECWIKNADTTALGHYMGSSDHESDFSYPDSGSGNPGSYGYWTMSNQNPGNSWTKVSGYITGHHASNTGFFETDAAYFSPLALFNYSYTSGTRACWISGWKIIRVDSVGNRIFQDDVQVKGELQVDEDATFAGTITTGDNGDDNSITATFSDSSFTRIHGYGLYMSRLYSYIRPTGDNNRYLYIGSSDERWQGIHIISPLSTFSNDVTLTDGVLTVNDGNNYVKISEGSNSIGQIELKDSNPVFLQGWGSEFRVGVGTYDNTAFKINSNKAATFHGNLQVDGDNSQFYLKSADKNIARIIPRGGTGDNLDKGLFSLIASDSTSGQTNIEKVRIDSSGTSWFDGGNVSFGYDVIVTGNLIVNGTTTTLNTQTVEVKDNIIQLNTTQGSPNTMTASTSGISVFRGLDTNGNDTITQASLIFDEGDDTWDLTNNLKVAGNATVMGNTILGNAFTDKTVIQGHLGIGDDSHPKIAYPGQNALWGEANNSTTGQVVIDIPGTLSNYDMMYMEIDMYEYNSTNATKLIIGAHNWNSSGDSGTGNLMWYNAGVKVIGSSTKSVYLGWRNDGTNNRRVIAIGETDSTWSYPTIHVSKVHGNDGYSSAIDWIGDWSINLTTSNTYFTKSPTTNFNTATSTTFTTRGKLLSSGATFTGDLSGVNATFSGTVYIPSKLEHTGDDDTYLNFSSDTITLVAGGNSTTFSGNGNATFPGDVALQQTGDVYLTLESTDASTAEEVAIKYNNHSTGSNYWWAGLNQSANYSLAYGTAYSGANVKMEISTAGNTTFAGSTQVDKTLSVGSGNSRFIWHSGDVTVSGSGTSNGVEIDWKDSTHYIPSLAYAFKVRLVTTGTGTDTGASYIVYYNNTTSAWVVRYITLASSGSNHPLLGITSDSGGNYMYAYHNHSDSYNIRYWVEMIDSGDQDMDGHSFGSDFHWQRHNDILRYTDGDVEIGGFDDGSNYNLTLGWNAVESEAVGTKRSALTFKTLQTAVNNEDIYKWDIAMLAAPATVTGEEFGSDLAFLRSTRSSTYVDEPTMILTRQGNVGIGTTSPGAKLQIGSATYAPNANLGNNLLQIKSPSGFAYLTIGNGDSANSTSYIGGASGFTVIGSVTDAGALSEYVRVTNSGNVGIGNSININKLDVSGNINVHGGNGSYLTFNNGDANIVISNNGTGRDLVFKTYNPDNGNNTERMRLDKNGVLSLQGNLKIKNALIDNASVTSATTTTTVASVSGTTYAAVFFDYVIYKSSNIRAGTVVACSDGTNVSFTETSTTDLGDTSDVTLAVDYSSSNFRLRATTTSSTWNIKAIIRAI